jgi:transposase
MPKGRAFPREFRAEAVQQYRPSGKSLREVAQDLGLAPETLRRWILQAEVDAGRRNGLTTPEREELRRIRRENRILPEGREILALCESFFATLETELVHRSVFRSHQEARTAVFDHVECFYNRAQRHSALGYLSPAEFERRHAELAVAARWGRIWPRPRKWCTRPPPPSRPSSLSCRHELRHHLLPLAVDHPHPRPGQGLGAHVAAGYLASRSTSGSPLRRSWTCSRRPWPYRDPLLRGEVSQAYSRRMARTAALIGSV